MTKIHTVTDTFPGAVLSATKWPDSFGTITVAAGTASISVDPGRAAIQSDDIYEFTNSYLQVKVVAAPAAGGAATDALLEVLMLSATGGTDAGFYFNAVTGNLTFASRTGYGDGSAVTIAYDPVAHLYWRMREFRGQVLWQTSPDGVAWTTRRLLASSPGWMAVGTNRAALATYRDSGVNDFAVVDDINVVSYTPNAGLTFAAHLNRLAGTTDYTAAAAANYWAGTTGLTVVDALHEKAGFTGPVWDTAGICNHLAGTTGLTAQDAISRVAL